MKTKQILEEAIDMIQYYLKEMDQYTPTQFTWKPSEDEWSLGQMMNHLIDAAYGLQLGAIAKCADDEAVTHGQKTEVGERVYQEGVFPSIRIKLPNDPRFVPENPNDKEEIKVKLLQLQEKLKEVEPLLVAIPTERTVKHRWLGELNAHEWFQLIPMHFRHHLRQKERIDQMLGNGGIQ
ncbi:DinB family protein [Laceyella putida]|uniref:DinB family protein n=1 Tax=Laceyella putida TaxID=110101 RepID=A0ABW2RF58_9BACL